jgi:hypothetical protein
LDLAEAAALYLPNPKAAVQSGITLHVRLCGLPLQRTLENCMVYDRPVGASTRACLHRRLGLPSSHRNTMHRNCADAVNLICGAKTQVRPGG